MQKWLILPLGALIVSSCLSAAAQPPTTRDALVPRPSAQFVVLVRAEPAQFQPVPIPPALPPAKTFVGFTAVLVLAKAPPTGLKHLLSVELVKTAFVTEARVPIAQFLGGRLQLDGFTSTHYLQNVLLGPSALRRPNVGLPPSTGTYGIRLSFRLGGDSQKAGTAGGWRRLARFVGADRGDRI